MSAALAFANATPVARTRPQLRLVPPLPGLTPAERLAVEIGRDDAFRLGWDAGLAASGWQRGWRRLLVRMTGWQVATPLADARLETLRLFAGMMRRDDRRLHGLAEELLAKGLSKVALREAIGVALG